MVLALVLGLAVASWQAVRAIQAERQQAELRAAAERASGLETKQRIEAQRARDEAQAAQSMAQEARDREEKIRLQAERRLYASKMNLAQQAWLQNDGGRLRRMLEETRDSPFRGFEWYYWNRQAHGAIRTLRGHTAGPISVAYSPDGRRIATAGNNDGWIKLWDATSSRELRRLKAMHLGVFSLAFSPDGRRLAAAGGQATRVYDADSGHELSVLGTNFAYTVAYSPDGAHLATGGALDDAVRLWHAASGKEAKSFRLAEPMATHAIAFSPDSKRMFTGHEDGTVSAWDLPTGMRLFSRKASDGAALAIAYSPVEPRLVVGTEQAAEIWDAYNSQLLLVLGTRMHGIGAVAYSPDGRRVITGARDGSIQAWDASTGRELGALRGNGGDLYSVSFSPDGRYILAGNSDGTAEIWAAPNDLTTDGMPATRLVGSGADDVALFSALTFSDDGQRLLLPGRRSARVWETSTSKAPWTLPVTNARPESFSPDGRRVVGKSRDGTAKVWDTATGRELLAVRLDDQDYTMTFSPDGTRLAAAGNRGARKLWQAATGRELLSFDGRSNRIHSVRFSPEGTRLLVCGGSSDSGVCEVLDMTAGKELFVIQVAGDFLYSAAFSPDGLRIVTADGHEGSTPKVFDAFTGHELLSLRGHRYGVPHVAYSPDAQRIISGGGDDTIRLWDAQTGEELLSLRAYSGGVHSVAFSPEGGRIASSGWNGVIKVWNCATPEQVAQWQREEQEDAARLAAPRNKTPATAEPAPAAEP